MATHSYIRGELSPPHQEGLMESVFLPPWFLEYRFIPGITEKRKMIVSLYRGESQQMNKYSCYFKKSDHSDFPGLVRSKSDRHTMSRIEN